ncbi:hypothetical protein FISHEDRAFT_49485 [Fistulina hepatica ATCC 64428]|uniref:GYF domain-containing protein n=1 Tax=Fistulina hepatica ATCC 64428 TaxID=1128425 RepID=A0A0D7A3S0_9AGAR|nr:hypothetical protein FISHEDRAFT_49485 [Fistulina hepatica ATCC 64428]
MPSAGSLGPRSAPVSSSTRQLIPRTPTTRRSVTPPPPANIPNIPEPRGRPPPYSSPVNTTNPLPTVHSTGSVVSLPRSQHSQRSSVNNVLAAAPPPPRRDSSASGNAPDAKTEWQQDSDEEAINVVAAGASGSQALDERTSSTASRTPTLPQVAQNPPPMFIPAPRSSQGPRRGHRPSSLDLTITHSTPIAPPEPSPVPTLLTLRQALSHLPMPSRSGASSATADRVGDAEVDGDDDDDDGDTGLSLAEILLESRLPDLPPVGTRRQQEPILIGSEEPSSPRTSDGLTPSNRSSNDASPTPTPSRSRRRWSVIIRQGQNPAAAPPGSPTAANRHLTTASTSAIRTTSPLPPVPANHRPASSHRSRSATRSTTRFIPRIISNAIANMRIDAEIGDRSVYGQASRSTDSETGSTKPRVYGTLPHAPPPKLEYLKLPGTKGALFVKAVETPKKSFLAILCGDNGEKVELFAGTYRTTLGLSRTFILPDSPRLLELQLQGDDLVEVFLVFSQNVFGLEPATVRVREVRIGRAERRAARRRAREIRTGEAAAVESNDNELQGDDDVNVNVSVSVAVQSQQDAPSSSALVGDQHPADRNASETQVAAAGEPPNERIAHAEELVALAAAQLGPYTTFQQLSFAPKFPLASIADEYIIPPTYPDFIKYRNAFENSSNDSTDLTQAQFSPPGLPVPTPTAPSKWYYRDPKDVIHGPWKASLMQAWYKDGLLPPDLPIRREEDAEFMLLKDLRLQCVDPTHPFRSPTVVPHPGPQIDMSDPDKPLLPPISLLAQPAHFGPPALFFSSRGGHSTAIVDARGRSVLKSRFLWSGEEPADDENKLSLGRMGDVKRLEAFDVDDRSVLVAMRQGGLEAVDLSDALLKPADVSRTVFPQFEPSPSNINRRGPFVWKIGTPVSKLSNTSLPSPLPTLTPLKSARLGVTHHLKKQGTGSAKSPGGKTDLNASNYDSGEEMQDEVLFLGRRDDELYICERNAGSFRILRLGPSTS